MGAVSGPPTLADLLQSERTALVQFVEREARGLLKKESAEDLVQGVHLRALQQEAAFTYRSDAEFFGWLKIIARQHIADRHDYWMALRRRATRMLRVTSSDATIGVQLEGKITGPTTFAARREMMELGAKAISLLLPRDQEIVRLVTEGAATKEVAAALGLAPSAAEQARHRAMQRFSKLVEMLTAH